jgi:hypothetical protein
MNLNLLAFTDFHGNQEAYGKAKKLIAETKPTLVIIAGDVFNHDFNRAKQHLVDLASAGRPLYFVPGNMDGAELASWPGDANIRGLHGRCEYMGGVALVGLGGSPYGQFKTVFEYSEKDARGVLERGRSAYHGGKLVLVSHCPPRDTKLDKVSSGDHVGSTSVREYVEKHEPILVISGHVHEARGIDSIGESTLVNPGPANNGKYASITVNETIKVRLLELPL